MKPAPLTWIACLWLALGFAGCVQTSPASPTDSTPEVGKDVGHKSTYHIELGLNKTQPFPVEDGIVLLPAARPSWLVYDIVVSDSPHSGKLVWNWSFSPPVRANISGPPEFLFPAGSANARFHVWIIPDDGLAGSLSVVRKTQATSVGFDVRTNNPIVRFVE